MVKPRDDTELDPARMTNDLVKAKQITWKLLSEREYARQELSHKLIQRGFDRITVDALLDELHVDGLQSDERFAEVYVRSYIARGHGPLRIQQALREKGVSDSIIEACFLAGNYDWFALAQALRSRKFGDIVPKDFAARAKQSRFLQYRGFSWEQIKAAFSKVD